MNKPSQIPFDLSRPTDYSKDSFIVGASNEEAYQALADDENWANNMLAIIGPKGAGKTHIGHIWSKQQQALMLDGAKGFIPSSHYKGQSIWLDNAASSEDNPLFALLNLALTGEIKALLLTDREMPSKWPAKLPDLVSRLRNIQIAHLSEPDDIVLFDIIAKLFDDCGLRVSEAVINYLMVHADRRVNNLRRLIADIDKAAAIEKANVSRSFVANFLQNKLF